MTKEMLNMTKEELINAIAETEKHGRELEKLSKDMVDTYNRLLQQIDIIEGQINNVTSIMKAAAEANAEMRLLLREKYGSFVM